MIFQQLHKAHVTCLPSTNEKKMLAATTDPKALLF